LRKLQPAYRVGFAGGTFTGAGVKTVVLFFEKGSYQKSVVLPTELR
jgi:hypothetical protein